jgi:hypothetical protein
MAIKGLNNNYGLGLEKTGVICLQFPCTCSLRLRFHANNSLKAAPTNGMIALANKGVYTAYLCSAGQYNFANIPGLKNAREARVAAMLE